MNLNTFDVLLVLFHPRQNVFTCYAQFIVIVLKFASLDANLSSINGLRTIRVKKRKMLTVIALNRETNIE